MKYNHLELKLISKDLSIPNRYISDKEYDTFANKQNHIYKHILNKNKTDFLYLNNHKYLKENIFHTKEYFDNLFDNIDKNITLDINQRKICIAEEDNLLVMAGAGAGKTTTIAAKVKYLVDKRGFKEDEILVIAFTNKAADEIKDKIHRSFKLRNINISTFHSLGLNIIRKGLNQTLSVVSDSEIYMIVSDYITKEIFTDKVKFKKFYDVFSSKLNFDKDKKWKDFKDFVSYHNYMYAQERGTTDEELANYIETQINKRRNYLKTIKGEYVKSKEEVDIANYLYKNNIYYEYEKTYGKSVGNNKSYKPDFYIKQYENINYIEHFGITESNYNSRYTKAELEHYLSIMKLKQNYFKSQPKDLFITTLSKYNNGLTYIDHLDKDLTKRGYLFNEKTSEEIYSTLKDTSYSTYFSNFINYYASTFIKLLKNKSKAELSQIRNSLNEIEKIQLDEMIKIYRYYELYLSNNNLIDFDDMIIKANEVLTTVDKKVLGLNYSYIIVDEYQDISTERFKLVKNLANIYNAKVLAVGDDWQSIFSFGGAELGLFLDFNKHMENAKRTLIPYTYRNSQELLDVAKKFIEKNQIQFKKNLISHKSLKNPVEIHIYDNKPKYRESIRIKKITEIIKSIYENNPKDKILLLGRYNSDKKKLLKSNKFTEHGKTKLICNDVPKAKIEFLTIHKSKGIGSDQVIIVNMEDARMGFPSKIEDEKLISLLTGNREEPVKFAEERRLFYVALTRTKNKTYILTPQTKMSIFIEEILDVDNVKILK